MIIKNLILGKYLSRPNRFTITFKTKEDTVELAHLHDPGRLKELLIEETNILLKYVENYEEKGRKTKYDVIGIQYDHEWLLLNSGYHNKLVHELIEQKKIDQLKEFHVEKPEYSYGNSRFDFLLKDEKENNMFLEVKGCTLVVKQEARFPDAPTTRGRKHVEELTSIRKEGGLSTIIILILQNNAKYFTPNIETDPDFGRVLEKAYEENVQILPVHILTIYKNNSLNLLYDKILPLKFSKKKSINSYKKKGINYY